MKRCDYHLHTEFSFDSREKMEHVCQKAIESGMDEICFTEHVEFAAEDAKAWPDIDRREQELSECRKKYDNRVRILKGIESGQPQKARQEEREYLSNHSFDFVIGSIHLVGDYGRPSSFLFDEENYSEFFMQYFQDAKKMAEECDFDVMGHITFPFRYVPKILLEEHPIAGFENEIKDVFKILVRRNKGIEINTSGLRTDLHATMPDEQIVSWFRECGGQIVTVGSDGHSMRSAFSGIEEGYRVLRAAGFDHAAGFHSRVAELYSI